MFKNAKINLLIASLFSVTAYAADLTTSKIEVVSTTPLPGLGISLDKIPYNIQTIKLTDVAKQNSNSIADYMVNNSQGVSVNETQGNPWQPDINFRGFKASPLLGTPQGMSVYLDGVRVNESFGETVNWDLIPMFAINGMQIVPGSNPVYGLNTLGGAIALQTKSGRTDQGTAIELTGGSWGRRTELLQHGGVSKENNVDYYVAFKNTHEDGWRKYSPTELYQGFGKLGWENEVTRLDLSYNFADNSMNGNGLQTTQMMNNLGRDSVFTHPDNTHNFLHHMTLNFSHLLDQKTLVSGNTYFRNYQRNSFNGDFNDGFSTSSNLWTKNGSTIMAQWDCNPGATFDETDCSNAVINRTRTHQNNYGLNIQIDKNQDLFGKKNQFTAGFAADIAKVRFGQSEQFGNIDAGDDFKNFFTADRGISSDLGSNHQTVSIKAKTYTAGIFATDTITPIENLSFTASGRYNFQKVETKDGINADGSAASLAGTHVFNRFNPSIGTTFTPYTSTTFYGSYSEANRAPSAIELGCANPDQPCKLPNAMAGDPPLKQVVARTFEIGGRGKFSEKLGWNTSVYHAENDDDIQFITNTNLSSALGFFKNVGTTKRRGLDIGLNGQYEKLKWFASYSFVLAQYETPMTIDGEPNSSRLRVGSSNDQQNVNPGDSIPGIPKNSLKLRTILEVTPKLNVGATVSAFTNQFARGNENNNHQPGHGDDEIYNGKGKIGGYALMNLDAQYRIDSQWKLFANINNVFDRDYLTSGMMAWNRFDNTTGEISATGAKSSQMLGAPGAPRAAWIGVRWEFGGNKSDGADKD